MQLCISGVIYELGKVMRIVLLQLVHSRFRTTGTLKVLGDVPGTPGTVVPQRCSRFPKVRHSPYLGCIFWVFGCIISKQCLIPKRVGE